MQCQTMDGLLKLLLRLEDKVLFPDAIVLLMAIFRFAQVAERSNKSLGR